MHMNRDFKFPYLGKNFVKCLSSLSNLFTHNIGVQNVQAQDAMVRASCCFIIQYMALQGKGTCCHRHYTWNDFSLPLWC